MKYLLYFSVLLQLIGRGRNRIKIGAELR